MIHKFESNKYIIDNKSLTLTTPSHQTICQFSLTSTIPPKRERSHQRLQLQQPLMPNATITPTTATTTSPAKRHTNAYNSNDRPHMPNITTTQHARHADKAEPSNNLVRRVPSTPENLARQQQASNLVRRAAKHTNTCQYPIRRYRTATYAATPKPISPPSQLKQFLHLLQLRSPIIYIQLRGYDTKCPKPAPASRFKSRDSKTD